MNIQECKLGHAVTIMVEMKRVASDAKIEELVHAIGRDLLSVQIKTTAAEGHQGE
jgi:hypothetical protein